MRTNSKVNVDRQYVFGGREIILATRFAPVEDKHLGTMTEQLVRVERRNRYTGEMGVNYVQRFHFHWYNGNVSSPIDINLHGRKGAAYVLGLLRKKG